MTFDSFSTYHIVNDSILNSRRILHVGTVKLRQIGTVSYQSRLEKHSDGRIMLAPIPNIGLSQSADYRMIILVSTLFLSIGHKS